MNITIANISSQISDQDFAAAVTAIGFQVTNHFEPAWKTGATLKSLRVSLAAQAPIASGTDAIIYVGDTAQDPTTGVGEALGYHSLHEGDVPYGFVYLDVSAKYREPWSCTLSHEVLELLADPEATKTIAGPAPDGSGDEVLYEFEVCDPTQGDHYEINSVKVSNFVAPSYFNLPSGNGLTNFLELPLRPFQVRPLGYFQYEQDGVSSIVKGRMVTKQQLRAKELLGLGRRNARRGQRRSSLRKSSNPPETHAPSAPE